ncbi:unnamed protein product [Rhizophagus irregularis]|nr:unnamed protein product [Rhizophagus irregularis]CAB4439488.1 unnamed protein product [Rhizophagus irregularis]
MNATPGTSYHYLIGVDRELAEYTECAVWIEDINHNLIAGVHDHHICDGQKHPYYAYYVDSDVQYWVHATVYLSLRDDKIRGPYQKRDTCFRIHGNAERWYFDETDCGGGVPQVDVR